LPLENHAAYCNFSNGQSSTTSLDAGFCINCHEHVFFAVEMLFEIDFTSIGFWIRTEKTHRNLINLDYFIPKPFGFYLLPQEINVGNFGSLSFDYRDFPVINYLVIAWGKHFC